MEIFEELEEDVFVNSGMDILPKKPTRDCSFEEKAMYMEKSIAWIKSEIIELKSQDKQLMRKFRTMLGVVDGLKRFRQTVEEQQGILGDLTAIDDFELQPRFVDVSASCGDESKGAVLRRQVSNYQRYNRIGFEERHVSFH